MPRTPEQHRRERLLTEARTAGVDVPAGTPTDEIDALIMARLDERITADRGALGSATQSIGRERL